MFMPSVACNPSDRRRIQILQVYATQVEVPDRKSICPDRPRRKVSMSRPSQTESAYVQTFVRSKFFVRSSCVQKSSCPDFRAFKIAYVQTIVRSKLHMSRLSCVQNCICPDYRAFKIVYVQTIVRSKLHMSRLSCVQNCICPDYRAFKIAYVQTFVRSKLYMSRLSCVQNCICPDFRAFKIAYVQTIVRSKLHMSRLSCVQNCICPDYRAFIFFSRPCNFERTTPPCAFILVWTYRLSVWHLNLGSLLKRCKIYAIILQDMNLDKTPNQRFDAKKERLEHILFHCFLRCFFEELLVKNGFIWVNIWTVD